MYYITLIIIILIVLNCLWGALRSTKKSLFVIAATAITGILTMLLAKPFALLFHKPFLKLILSFVPENINEPILSELVSLFLKPLLTVAFYIPLFVIIYLLMKIPVVILSEKTKDNTKTPDEDDDEYKPWLKENILSIAISGANCLLFFYLLFLPLSGLTTSFSEDVSAVTSVKSESTAIQNIVKTTEKVDKKTEVFTGDPLLALYSKIGGNALYKGYSKIGRNGINSDLHKEMLAICNIFKKAAPLITDTRIKLNPETAEGVKAVKKALFGSEFIKDYIYDILDEASSKWIDDKEFLGFVPQELFAGSRSSEKINSVIEVIVEYLYEASDKEKDALFTTAADGISIVAETDILNAERYDSGSFAIEEINDSTVFTKLIRAVDDNTASLAAEVIERFSDNTEGHILALFVKNMGSVNDSEAEKEGEYLYRFFTKLTALDKACESSDVNNIANLLTETMEIAASSTVIAPAVHELSFEPDSLNIPKHNEFDRIILLSVMEGYRLQLPSNSPLKKGTTFDDFLRIMNLKQ